MSAPVTEQPAHAQAFRRRLLDGLAASIEERGYRDTTVADIVRQHRDLAVELGVMPEGSPATLSARDVSDAYAAEPGDLATGLTLREAWSKVLTRAAEELRREIARGRLNGRAFFTIAGLAGKRRAKYLAAAASDLDRRDDPAGRARRGPAPPTNHDRLTDGEIPQ